MNDSYVWYNSNTKIFNGMHFGVYWGRGLTSISFLKIKTKTDFSFLMISLIKIHFTRKEFFPYTIVGVVLWLPVQCLLQKSFSLEQQLIKESNRPVAYLLLTNMLSCYHLFCWMEKNDCKTDCSFSMKYYILKL